MNKKNFSYVTSIVFLIMIFGIGWMNLKTIVSVVKDAKEQDATYFNTSGKRLEEDYRVQFWKRRDWINLYGAVQKTIGRELIGNADFLKTENGLMDYVSQEEDVMPFAEEMVELKQILDMKEIPLLYIQMPAREEKNSTDPENLLKTRAYYQQIREITDAAGIECMDEDEILQDEAAPARNEFYFKTDIHTTTEGEIWMAEKIADKLNEEYQINIENIIQKNDSRFYKKAHLFLGNLAQSTGVWYNGIDSFEEYVPKEETAYQMTDVKGQWSTTGSFEDVLMNGYNGSGEEEIYTYWITNYLKYGAEGYHIENLNSEGPRLLFICDSLCYRTLAYLSMECKEITVLDPRFYTDDTNLVEKVLSEREYDAAVYLHGTFYTTDYSMFGRGKFEK